ncbi:CcdB family protein [Oricola sp.]|uniref:CcdB family protein n=1 Tax=Oricola sp. TaxID=1979950 RepID=UPI0025E57E83|nr:CcdB family protein [Oricola sp.]MCI5073688.1 CcdB family protein [Oricola sp.]
MARYDVHPFDGAYALDVQSEIVDMFETRTVVPLLPRGVVPTALPRLHPVFKIENVEYTMATHFVAAVPKTALKPRVANLAHEHDRIVAALDMLFHGF